MSRLLKFETLERRQVLASVVAAAETAGASGAADDVAIWIHPTDPTESRVIGAIKSGTNSLEVYGLDGTRVQDITTGDINNVDLRYNFPMVGGPMTLLAGSDRASDSIALYSVSPTGELTSVAARTIGTGMDIYGCAMYVSPVTGKYYVFVSSESGDLQQWELFDAGGGKVDAKRVRHFDVGGITEGLVADDGTGYLYVGEENVGIWRYSAEPEGGTSRTHIDSTGGTGNLRSDVEGLTIFYRPGGQGYLIASSQGSNDFVIYQRAGTNPYVGRFNIVAGGGIDRVADTDGIDVTNFDLGGPFAGGMFVAQDSDTNFKLVSWEAISVALEGEVEVDTTWDPRQVGSADPSPRSQGDFNDDGIVSVADFVLWRNQLGFTVAPSTGADGTGDGLVDEADYLVWKSHYGEVASAAVARGAESPTSRATPPAPPLFWESLSPTPSARASAEPWGSPDNVRSSPVVNSRPELDEPISPGEPVPPAAEFTQPLATAGGDRRGSGRWRAHEVAWDQWQSDAVAWRGVKAGLDAFGESIPE